MAHGSACRRKGERFRVSADFCNRKFPLCQRTRFVKHNILVADALKTGVRDALGELRKQGVREIVMLTGDRKENAQTVAAELGLDEAHAELLPEQKVEWLEKLKGKGGRTAFVGDGINDAPVLAGADLGITMGGIGSDAAIEAADVVLMDDDIGINRRACALRRLKRNAFPLHQTRVAQKYGFAVFHSDKGRRRFGYALPFGTRCV